MFSSVSIRLIALFSTTFVFPGLLRARPQADKSVPTVQPLTVKVILTQAWTSTGVFVEKGDKINITASGTLHWFTSGCPGTGEGGDCSNDPDGRAWSVCEKFGGGFLVQKLNCWSLVGKIGEGSIFQIGKSLKEFEAASSGELLLGVNDSANDYSDNTGDWTAIVTTCGKKMEVSTFARYFQLQSNWCWAAASEMVMAAAKPGKSPSQCEIVSRFIDSAANYNSGVKKCCPPGGDAELQDDRAAKKPANIPEACNVPNTFATVLHAFHFTAQEEGPFSLSEDQIKLEINAGNLIAFRIATGEGAGEHIRILYGYQICAGRLMVLIFDPELGDQPPVAYGDAKFGTLLSWSPKPDYVWFEIHPQN